MCQCSPEIRTPFCGRGTCVWPTDKTGVRDMTPAERLAHYTMRDEHLQEEIKKAQHELETFLKAQHDVRREIFKAQFDVRRPNG